MIQLFMRSITILNALPLVSKIDTPIRIGSRGKLECYYINDEKES